MYRCQSESVTYVCDYYFYVHDMETRNADALHVSYDRLDVRRSNIKIHGSDLWNTLPPFIHDDVIKWKYFPRYWPFVREIHRSPVNFPHKGQWRGALMFTLICARMNGWVNNREAGDLRRYLAHYDVIVMIESSESSDAKIRLRNYLPDGIMSICWENSTHCTLCEITINDNYIFNMSSKFH